MLAVWILLLASCSVASARSGGGIFLFGGFPRGSDCALGDPLVAGKELLFEWREIEPEEGRYNWKLIDETMRPWVSAGKKVVIRIMSACNENSATPDWVFDRYRVPKVDSNEFSASNIVFPVFWNPVFVQKYSEMVSALARRYDGNPGIEFVQIGGVGRWEETYVHTDNEQMSKRWQELGYTHAHYIEHCKRMARVFMNALKRTPLVLSISIGGPDAHTQDRKVIGYELAEFAVRHGLYLKQNGWGAHYSYTDHEHFSRIFINTIGKTRRIYEQGVATSEPWGWEKATFRSSINRALLDCPDYLWIYETDLCKPEMRRDIEWAAQHLGMKSYRQAGPLYIRFAQMRPRYHDPDYSPVFEDEFNGILSCHPREPYLPLCRPQPDSMAGIECKKTTPEFPYIYLDIEDSPILQESRGSTRIDVVDIAVTYFDQGGGTVTVDYNWNGSAFESSASFDRHNTRRWKTAQMRLRDLRFETNLSVAEKDLRLRASDGNLALSKLVVWLGGR
ncbi:MAG: beta-galactosidase [Armatimonadetes bacterium]|nr:beta-galactosidase [Armatimonadota bacterium]